eukprot:753857-Hanusia_phi.AAC.4
MVQGANLRSSARLHMLITPTATSVQDSSSSVRPRCGLGFGSLHVAVFLACGALLEDFPGHEALDAPLVILLSLLLISAASKPGRLTSCIEGSEGGDGRCVRTGVVLFSPAAACD